ncbi:LppU/SCO3897 family protein [Streptomyces sp. NPDC002004]
MSRPNQSPLVRIAVIVIAVIGASVWWFVKKDEPYTPPKDTTSEWAAEVGDCMQNHGTDDDPDLQVVDCSDSKAQYKVEQTHADTCEPGQTKYTQTRRGRVLLTLCMSEIKK